MLLLKKTECYLETDGQTFLGEEPLLLDVFTNRCLNYRNRPFQSDRKLGGEINTNLIYQQNTHSSFPADCDSHKWYLSDCNQRFSHSNFFHDILVLDSVGSLEVVLSILYNIVECEICGKILVSLP